MMLAEVRNSEEYIIYIGWLAAPVGGGEQCVGACARNETTAIQLFHSQQNL